jgi:hypothetical protein
MPETQTLTDTDRLELARDALRRAGYGTDEIGDNIAGLIDRFNTEARNAVASLGQHTAEQRAEVERYRREASDSARTAGKLMRVVVDLYDALCLAPRTPQVEHALSHADKVIRDSAWMSERISKD